MYDLSDNNDTGMTPEFIWANLTNYQKQVLELKYIITLLVDNRPKTYSRIEMFDEVSTQVSLTFDRVKKIYYTTKK